MATRYQIESPLELAALLAAATAKMDGDMSSDEKKALLDLFQIEFSISKKESAELLLSSVYLLGTGEEVKNNPANVIQPCLQQFTQQRVDSALKLLNEICAIASSEMGMKEQFVEEVTKVFGRHFAPTGKWQ